MAYRCEQRIDWGHCDEAGLVFYPNYFGWMDAAFHQLFAAAGHSQRSMRKDFEVFGTPLIHADCGFRAPASYNQTLSVCVEIRKWGDSSLSLNYRFEDGDRLIAEGTEDRVFVSQSADGRIGKTAIPDAVRSAVSAVIEAETAQ